MIGWLECVISCLIAVHSYLARLDGVDIELLRRSSFGFLEPQCCCNVRLNSNPLWSIELLTKRK